MKVVYSFLAVAFFGIIHQGVATKCFKGLVSNTYQGTFPVHCYDGWETCYTMRITSRHNFGHVTNTYYGCLRDLDTCKHYCQQTLQTAPHLRVVSCAENCCYGDYCNMPFHLRS